MTTDGSERPVEVTSVRPTTVDVPPAAVDDLRARLERTRWAPQPPGTGWESGVPTADLAALVQRWRRDFDWWAVQGRLNAWPQVEVEVTADGVQETLHVVHVRSSRADAVPLLLTHGWPSTVLDFLDLFGPLSEPEDPAAPAFHVIAPSLPGFAFSGPLGSTGWSVRRTARAWAAVARALGYEHWIAQGGDFGALVSPEVGRVDPARTLGVHVNALVASPDWSSPDPLGGLDAAERAVVADQAALWRERQGYAVLQGTRPQTLAHALVDSPAGLLAWDWEWFADYDLARGVQTPVDPLAVVADVSATWLTATPGTSARMYRDAGAEAFGVRPVSGVPTAVAVFPGDHAVRGLAQRSHRVVRWNSFDRGGHFAALQAPDLLLADLRAFTADVLAGRFA